MRIFNILFYIFNISTLVSAQLSPGDLSRPHADLEGLSNCQKCHALEQQISPERCFDCHINLSERVKNNKGLHAGNDYQKCQTCHAEHNGRDFELIWWSDGQDKFDHNKTGYNLEGKHKELSCRKCHTEKHITDSDDLKKNKIDPQRTFLGLTTACTGCHADPHSGQFEQTCESCHSTSQWKPVQTFDHQKTNFPLTGGHLNIACAKCHPANDNQQMVFRPVRHEQCSDCHQDPHQNRFGAQCTGCHTTTAWRGQTKSGFNHDLTRYPLRGKHQYVNCTSCHPPGKPMRNIRFSACNDCHRDYHRGAFANHSSRGACESCHIVDGFSPSTYGLSEHQKSDYPIEGAHLAVPCIACHRTGDGPPRFVYSNRDCQVCHKNPHGPDVLKYTGPDKTPDCAFCHGVSAWQTISFDHDKTGLPLQGKHAIILCSQCHKKSKPGEFGFSGLNKECHSCHKDIHAGQFEIEGFVDCSRCHTARDWLAEKFDHTRDSRFPLEGRHIYVKCSQCHPETLQDGVRSRRYKPLETACASCHKKGVPVKE